MALLGLLAPGVLAPAAAAADPRDPLIPLLHRMDTYLRSFEVDGVTLDSRYAWQPPLRLFRG